MVNYAWDVPLLHNPLNVGLLDAIYKLHVHLKACVILMKPTVPKIPREVCIEGYGRRLKQLKPLL